MISFERIFQIERLQKLLRICKATRRFGKAADTACDPYDGLHGHYPCLYRFLLFHAQTVAAASAIILIMRLFIKSYSTLDNNSVENIHALRLCEKLSS